MGTPSVEGPDTARLFRVANGVMFVLFGYSMVVQHNDPDAANWMAAYGVAAILCLSAVLERPRWKLSGLLAGISGVSAAVIAPEVPAGQGLVDSEAGRELMGMILVCLWTALLTWWWHGHPALEPAPRQGPPRQGPPPSSP